MCVDKHNFSNKNYNMKQYIDLNNYFRVIMSRVPAKMSTHNVNNAD